MREIYRRAKEAGNSWNQREAVDDLATRESEFTVLAKRSNAEQWQVNVAVHFNSWDNLRKEDFAPVVKAFRGLLAGFTYSDCGEYLHVLPDRETAQCVCCECGKTNMNLRKKSG